ncbi:response regulator transcription factor [Sphingomonas sp.]|jgi:DNA-binding response OmpR family regulator|uniref:response regulator transcription factor n=1 Tax=Sphingomonas sp. TaxID=28214 RepID=UPI002DEF4C35|nr:response regulator [Sphingomonas sp.]HEV2567087.1 response regulator [Sphingomonas sp.]
MRDVVTILLVEDESLIALNLQEALEEAGFAVCHVPDGECAFAAIDACEANVAGVITDIQLGGDVDGWAVARHARELIPHVPVIYVSGDSAHQHTVSGVPNSIMVQKPFASVQIITAISTLLNAFPPA